MLIENWIDNIVFLILLTMFYHWDTWLRAWFQKRNKTFQLSQQTQETSMFLMWWSSFMITLSIYELIKPSSHSAIFELKTTIETVVVLITTFGS